MFYNGNPKAEPGAIVCLIAPSFTRFGNFQILTARRDLDFLKNLLTIRYALIFRIWANLRHPFISPGLEVCRITAEMIVHWQRVGFVHGVRNTDNMSTLALRSIMAPMAGWKIMTETGPPIPPMPKCALLFRQPTANRFLESGATSKRHLSAY